MTSGAAGRGFGHDTNVCSADGLRIIFGSGSGLFFGAGVILVYGFSVFITPIVESTGWDRQLVSAALGPAALALGLMSPILGRAADRFGPRRVLILAAVLQSVGLALLGLYADSLALFAALFVLAAMMASGQAPVPYMTLIVGWFVRQRGLATGLVLAGSGLGIALMPIAFATLIDAVGWRAAYVVIAGAALLVNLAVSWRVLKDAPNASTLISASTQSETGGTETDGMTVGSSLSTADFWVILVSFGVTAMLAAGGSISLPSLMRERGLDATLAASFMGGVGIAMIFARIFVGWLLDRVSPLPLAAIVFLGPAIGYAALSADIGFWGPAIAAVAFGLTLGTEGDSLPYILAKRFGRRNFGTLYGFQFCGYAIGTGFGLSVLNAVREAKGDTQAFGVMIAVAIMSALLLATLSRRKLEY